MNLIEVLLLSIALSCDAMVCSVIYGTKSYSATTRCYNATLFATFFGLFQFVMPLLGFYCGNALLSLIAHYDHWVGFSLLLAVSVNMLKEAFSKEDPHKEAGAGRIKILTVFVLAIATSLDALAVGISVAMINTQILYVSAVIGITCFILSFGCFYAATPLSKIKGLERFMNIAGAIVLLLIGIKILIEHGVFA